MARGQPFQSRPLTVPAGFDSGMYIPVPARFEQGIGELGLAGGFSAPQGHASSRTPEKRMVPLDLGHNFRDAHPFPHNTSRPLRTHLDTSTAYKTHSMATLIQGVTAMVCIYILSLIPGIL